MNNNFESSIPELCKYEKLHPNHEHYLYRNTRFVVIGVNQYKHGSKIYSDFSSLEKAIDEMILQIREAEQQYDNNSKFVNND